MILLDNYWVAFLLFILSVAIAFFYYKKQTLILKRWNLSILIILRSLSSFLLLLLFLTPIIKCNKTKVLKPKSIILVDNSKSILNYKISSEELKRKTNEIAQKLSSNGFDCETKVFDQSLQNFDSLSNSGVKTDILSALQTILETNSDNNLQKVILITDGNYNLGNNPIFLNNPHWVEISTILVGDTTQVSDVNIENVEHSPILLSNENSLINVNISAVKSKNSKVEVSLFEITERGNRLINSSSFLCHSEIFSQNVQFKLLTPTKGKHHYRLIAKGTIEEKNARNNQRDFYVDVVDGTKNIEILSNFPHPDISALKNLLESNKSIKVKTTINDIISGFSSESDLIILYQIPNNLNSALNLFEKAKSTGKSVLFILGSQSNFSHFNQIQNCYRVNVKGDFSQDYFPVLNANFSKFYLKENTNQFISKFPPLSNSLLSIQSLNEASHLLYSKIGNVSTSQPLISISNQDNIYVGIIAAENIWKWKIYNYTNVKSTEETQDIFEKLINYLVVKKDKKQLITSVSNHKLAESEKLMITANTYNELYQPAKANSIKCTISNANGLSNKYEMISNENNYLVEPKDLKQGDYTYNIEAVINGKKIDDKGSFSIYKEDVEEQFLPANYDDMNAFTIKNNGKLVLWNNYQSLLTESPSELTNKIIEESTKLKPNDIFLVLFLILCLLSIEWMLRKYFGLS